MNPEYLKKTIKDNELESEKTQSNRHVDDKVIKIVRQFSDSYTPDKNSYFKFTRNGTFKMSDASNNLLCDLSDDKMNCRESNQSNMNDSSISKTPL